MFLASQFNSSKPHRMSSFNPSNRDLPPTPCTSFIPHRRVNSRHSAGVFVFFQRFTDQGHQVSCAKSLEKRNTAKSWQKCSMTRSLTKPRQLESAGRAGRVGWEVPTKCSTEKSIGNAGIFKQAKKKSSISMTRNLIGHSWTPNFHQNWHL